MKKVLLFSGVFAGVAASAQTFTINDTLYSGMSTTFYVMDSNAVSLSGTTGTGVTWDYSGIYGVMGVATNLDQIIDASSAPLASTFPMADYNDDLANFASVYFSHTPTETWTYGVAFTLDGFDVVIEHSGDPLKTMEYPMAVGDSYNDNSAGVVNVNSGMATGTTSGDVTVTLDGSGTLNVGGDIYTNVLRVKMVENISTSITVVPFPPDNGTVTRTIYSYYQLATDKQPIFMHGNVTIASTLINDDFTSVYYSSLPNYLSVAEQNTGSFTVYPNPSNGQFTVTTDGSSEKLNVFTSTGQLVASVINPKMTETIDISTLGAGLYIVQVTNDGVVTEEKLIVE